MERRIVKSPRAKADLTACADYISRHNHPAAVRFLEAAEAAFRRLATSPFLGTRCRFRHPETVGLRMWTIRGFRNYVVFYRVSPDGIDVVRVLHAARDTEAVFRDRTSE